MEKLGEKPHFRIGSDAVGVKVIAEAVTLNCAFAGC